MLTDKIIGLMLLPGDISTPAALRGKQLTLKTSPVCAQLSSGKQINEIKRKKRALMQLQRNTSVCVCAHTLSLNM